MVSAGADTKRIGSLVCTQYEMARAGGNVREGLSSGMGLLIGQLRRSVKMERGTPFIEYPAMLTACLELLSAFSGMERENINRGVGWLFMSIGRRLERAIYLARMLRQLIHPLGEQDWP